MMLHFLLSKTPLCKATDTGLETGHTRTLLMGHNGSYSYSILHGTLYSILTPQLIVSTSIALLFLAFADKAHCLRDTAVGSNDAAKRIGHERIEALAVRQRGNASVDVGRWCSTGTY